MQLEELVDFLSWGEERFDLFIAADVLIDRWKLEFSFERVVNSATPAALLLCSTETCGRPGVNLQATGRYARDHRYMQQLAGGQGLIHPISGTNLY